VTVENVPRIHDVTLLLDGLRRLGVRVTVDEGHTVRLDMSTLGDGDPHPSMVSGIRGSILLVPAPLARTGRAVLPRPGGDRIGRRRLDTHLLALSELGAEVTGADILYFSLRGRSRGTDVFLDESSVTATENVVTAAALAEGTTHVLNAASEPHVQGSVASSTPWARGSPASARTSSGWTVCPSSTRPRTASAPIISRSGHSSRWRP